MQVAKVRVDGARARVLTLESIPANASGLTVAFVLSDVWDGLQATCLFKAGDIVCRAEEFSVVGAIIPKDVLKYPGEKLFVGLQGVNRLTKTVIPTIWADLGDILPSAYDESYWDDDDNAEGDESGNQNVLEKIDALFKIIGDVNELNTEDKDSIVDAINSNANSIGYIKDSSDIDSFSDVEAALKNNADQVVSTMYAIDF